MEIVKMNFSFYEDKIMDEWAFSNKKSKISLFAMPAPEFSLILVLNISNKKLQHFRAGVFILPYSLLKSR
jgi:hypothetical protein